MKKPIDMPVNSSARRNTQADKPVSRPILANNMDVTKITGVAAGNQALHDFATRVSEASKGKATTLTLTIGEASGIFANLAELVLANKDLQDQVFALQNKIIEERNKQENTITINADGGGF